MVSNRLILACGLVIILGVLSFMRSSVYKDEMTLWGDTVLKSPYKARPHHRLGFALMMAGHLQAAAMHFETAIAMRPDYTYALNNLATV